MVPILIVVWICKVLMYNSSGIGRCAIGDCTDISRVYLQTYVCTLDICYFCQGLLAGNSYRNWNQLYCIGDIEEMS